MLGLWPLVRGDERVDHGCMRPSVRLGRIAHIEVGIHWSVLVIMGLLGGVSQLDGEAKTPRDELDLAALRWPRRRVESIASLRISTPGGVR